MTNTKKIAEISDLIQAACHAQQLLRLCLNQPICDQPPTIDAVAGIMRLPRISEHVHRHFVEEIARLCCERSVSYDTRQ